MAELDKGMFMSSTNALLRKLASVKPVKALGLILEYERKYEKYEPVIKRDDAMWEAYTDVVYEALLLLQSLSESERDAYAAMLPD